MTRRYPAPQVKILWGYAAGRCAFPGCHQLCIADATEFDLAAVIGIISHIRAHSDTGPRANPDLSPEQRDCYDNWILLCDNHHKLVDVQPNSYTSEDLIQWKADHENWVRERLEEKMPEVKLVELEYISRAIMSPPSSPSYDFKITDPREKMRRNDLTEKSHFLLTLGLGKAKEVQDLITDITRFDIEFPERLKAGFVSEYKKLKSDGYSGDALFEALLDFACESSTELDRRAAGLAVLCYLFDKCEIFER